MEEIKQVSMTREEERTQLIENILMSEIKYADWHKEVVTAKGERKVELEKMIANDEATIATWMANYDITFAHLDTARTAIFTKAKEDKQDIYDKQEAEIKETIENLVAEMVEIPEKRADTIKTIDALIAGVNLYKP